MQRIFNAIAREGTTVRSLARNLNSDSVPAPSAGKRVYQDGRVCRWNPSTLYRMLADPSYKGDTVLWRHRSRGAGKMWQLRDEGEWIRLPEGTTPAIVPTEIWEAAQERLRAGTVTTTRNANRPYLLRGLIYCSICGKRMYTSPERGRTVYRCSSRDKAGGACGGKRVNGEAVETWAWNQIEMILRDPLTIIAEVERRRKSGPDVALQGSRDATARLLAKLEKQRERLIRRYADADDNSFPWELVEREVARVESERRAAHALLADIDARLNEQETSIVRLDSLRTYCDRVSANLEGADFETKRNAVEALVERIDANGRDWTLLGSIPTGEVAGVTSHSSS